MPHASWSSGNLSFFIDRGDESPTDALHMESLSGVEEPSSWVLPLGARAARHKGMIGRGQVIVAALDEVVRQSQASGNTADRLDINNVALAEPTADELVST